MILRYNPGVARGAYLKYKRSAFLIGMTAAALGALLSYTPLFLNFERATRDLRIRHAASVPSHPGILHLDIDDGSIEKIGRWPWNRDIHARTIDVLTELGAKAIVFDIEFTEPQKPYLDEKRFSDFDEAFKTMGASGNTSLLDRALAYLKEEKIDEAELNLRQYLLDLSKMHASLATLLKESYVKPDESIDRSIARSGRVTLAMGFNAEKPKILPSDFPQRENCLTASSVTGSVIPFLPEQAHAVVPLADFSRSAHGLGCANQQPAEADGVFRRTALVYRYRDKLYPQLGLKIALDQMGDPQIVSAENGTLKIGNRMKIPIDPSGSTLLDWPGSGGFQKLFRHLSYADVARIGVSCQAIRGAVRKLTALAEELRLPLTSPPSDEEAVLRRAIWPQQIAFVDAFENTVKNRSNMDPEVLQKALFLVQHVRHENFQRSQDVSALEPHIRDALVFIGATHRAGTDLKSTPISAALPGVTFHTVLCNMALNNRFVRETSFATDFTLFLFLVGLTLPAAVFLRPSHGFIAPLGIALLYPMASTFIYSHSRIFIPITPPMMGVMATYFAVMVYRSRSEERIKNQIRDIFAQYLDPQLVDELIADPSKAALGGARRDLTIFFSDVQGFTRFTEEHAPDKVVAELIDYLTVISRIILRHGGYLDKYMGDGMMAIFGLATPPETAAVSACRAASEIRKVLTDMRPPFQKTRIGIAGGSVVVGNIGWERKKGYTAIGDAANVASRLEHLNKKTNTQILIDETTYHRVKGEFPIAALGSHPIEGRAAPVTIFSL